MLFVTYAVLPLQYFVNPYLGTYAALLFPVHGIRVISAWMFGWWSVPYLLCSQLLMALLFAAVSVVTPYLEFTNERLLSWALTSIVAICGVELCKAFGLRLAHGISEISQETWKQLAFIGLVSSILNSVGNSVIFSEQIDVEQWLAVALGYVVGDTAGTLVCFILLMAIFRGWRGLTGKI